MASWEAFPVVKDTSNPSDSWDSFPKVEEEPMIDVSDTLKAAGQAIGGITTTAPHAFRQLYSGLDNPWQRSEGYKASQAGLDRYQQELEAANQAAVESGDISTSSRGMRQAGQSLGFSAGAMGAGLVGSSATGAAGRGIGTAIAGPAGAATGEAIGRGVGALGAGYGAAYRMAGAQFLDDASKEIDAKFMEKLGRLPNEQEQKEAYDELLPLAQAFGHAEAGPEAIGNLAMAKAGKFILGLGINKVKGLAAGALAKVGAGAGGLATELGSETVTQVEQNRLEEQKNALLSGQAPPEQGPRTLGEYQTALGEVAPATLATMGLIGSVPTAYKAGELAVKAYKQPANAAAAELLHAASVSSDDTELTNKATEEQIQDSVDATVVGLGEQDAEDAATFAENLQKVQDEGVAADIQAAQMRAQEEAAQAQAAADRQAQFEALSQNEPAITTPVGGAIPAVGQEEAAAIQPEQQMPDSLGILPEAQPQAVGQEPQAEMVGTTTTNSGVAVPSNLTNSVGTVEFLSRDDPNRLLLEDGFAYRTVSEGEVNHFAQEGALLTDPNLAGQKKKSRGQTSQKMFSHINLEHPEYGYRPNQLVIRVPINRIPIGTKGVAIRAKDAEVMRFDGGKWVGTPVSELAQPQAETTSPVTEMARQAAARLAGTEQGPNLGFQQVQPTAAEQPVERRYTVANVKTGKIVSRPDEPMTHKEAVTFRSKFSQPNNFTLVDVTNEQASPQAPSPKNKPTQTSSGKKVGDKIDPGEDVKVLSEDDQSTPGMPEELTVLEVEGILDAGSNKVFARRRDMTPAEIAAKQDKIRQRNAVAAEMGFPQEAVPQPISPQGAAPTGIATTGQPMSGDSGIARDVTKVEQMTPQEAVGYKLPRGRGKDILPSMDMMDGDTPISSRASEQAGTLDHAIEVAAFARKLQPVSAEAVDQYGINLPEGYHRQGDLYVYQPLSPAANKQEPPLTPSGQVANEGGGPVTSNETEAGFQVQPPVATKETPDEEVSSADIESKALEILLTERPKLSERITNKAKAYFQSRDENDLKDLSSGFKGSIKKALQDADPNELHAVLVSDREQVEKLKQQAAEDRKADEARAKLQAKLTESRRGAYDSIVGTPTGVEMNAVSEADGQESLALVNNSGDVPGVLNAFVGTSSQFLANPENETNFPDLWKILSAGRVDEGNFAYGRAFVFTDGIGVNASDRRNAERLGVTPSVAAVRRVLIHEGLVHRGIYGLPAGLQMQILQWVRQNTTPEQLDNLARDYPQYENWRNNPNQMLGLCEEYLAKEVEKITKFPKDGPLSKLFDILRDIWRWVTGETGEPTVQNLRDIVKLLKAGVVAADARLVNGGKVDIKESRPSFASPINAELARAAERFRQMQERQAVETPEGLKELFNPNAQGSGTTNKLFEQQVTPQQIRSEIRAAYDRAIVGSGSVQTSLQSVYDEAKTQIPTLTEKQFGEQLQALYEDGSAFLVPADRSATMMAAGEKWGVYDASGMPASYVGVLPSEVKASVARRPNINIPNEIKEQARILGKEGDMALNRHRALKALQEAQPKFHIKQDDEAIVAVAINIVDALKSAGVTPQELNGLLTDPEFLDDLGIPIDSSLYQAVAMEMYRSQQDEVSRLEKEGKAAAANKLRQYVSAMQKQWYESGTRGGQRLNVRLQLINNPRYQGLFLATHLNESMREAAQAKVEAQTDIKAEDVAKANDTAGAEAADDVAAEIEELEMAELDRLGEEQLDDAEKPLWQQIKGYITKLGAIAYARLQKASGNIKASNAAESASDMVRRYISMPDKEIDAEEADIHQKLKAAMKKFMGKGTETQKKVKKDLVDRTTEVAKKPRAKRAPKVETAEQKAKLEKAKKDKANATAARIIYRTEELFRQGFKNDIRSGQDKPSIYKEFIQQIQEPTDLDNFAARLAKLKVSREVAERMFRTAALEKTDREAVRNERNRIRLQELREKQAMQLVYLTEQNLRQSGIKGIQDRTASENDSIRKAFKDQINAGKEDAELAKPLTEEEFVKRLAALKVRPEVAKIMFKTADRERADIEASDKFDLLESPRALRNMMRKLAELRMADKTPFLKPISWKKLFSLSKGTQEQRRSEMEAAIRADESLQNLSEEDQKKLADLIEAAWNSQREKVFKTEIDRLTRLKKTSEKAKKAITDNTEKLLEMVNQGVLDNDELYALLAEKFGFKPLTQEQKAEIEDIAQKLQEDLPPYRRTQLVSKFKDIITKTADVPFAQKAADWWVTAVLTGPRTAFTIGLGFLSGGYQVLSNAIVTVARHSGDINAWKAAGASINDWVASMPRNARNALGYLWDGREDRLDPTMSNISSWLNLDKKSLTQTDTASVLLNSKNPISRLAGGFMTFFKRLLVALDMFNAASAKDGSLAMSYYQTRQSQDAPFSLKELSSLRDFKAARDHVLGTEFGGVEPTNPVQKSLLDAWASQYMWQQIAKFEGIVENATYNAQQGAMSLDPSGLGGHLYHAILKTQANQKELSESFMQSSKKALLRADGITEKSVAYNRMLLAYIWHFAAYNMLGAVGLKFARYAGNRLNQTISFVPVLGAFRLHETEGVPREMHRSQIIANQAVGSFVTIIALALMKEMADEPDEEKRGWGWEGSWDTLTPERKSQRMSAGKQAYTLTIGGKTFKYNNWPMGGVMAAVGSLMDMIQYSPDKWNERTIPGKVASAGLAALLSVGDSASLSQFSEMFGRSVQTRDPLDAVGNTLSKTAANYAGGFIPRIFKDVDKMFVNPEINRYKTPFEFMAREVPIYRSSVGKPMLDIFARPVAPAAGPTSREFITQPTEPEYRQIGRLNERGIWLTSANPENRLVGKGSKKRHMTDEEGLRYIKATGNAYREFVLRNTDKILSMTPERGKQYVLDKADEIRDRAAKQSIKR